MSNIGTQTFPGFRPLEANFTTTPNEFFDKILPHYPLCVVTVVGLLIRATNGWRDSVTGDRRVEADMSYADMVRMGMSRGSAQNGVKGALEAGFIVVTGEHTNRDKTRYAIRWADDDALKTAVIRQRKANDDQRPLSKRLDSGVPEFGIPEFGIPEFGIPEFGTHIKESVDPKESVVYNVSKKPLNVTESEIARLFGQTFNAEERDLYIALVLEPVRELMGLTRDFKSRIRFIQLREICLKNNHTVAWSAAVVSLQKRMQLKSAGPLGKPGAYFNTVCVRELDKRGVTVPSKANEPERAAVRDLIAESLSELPQAETTSTVTSDASGSAVTRSEEASPEAPRPKEKEIGAYFGSVAGPYIESSDAVSSTGNAEVWQLVQQALQSTIGTAVYQTYFRPLKLIAFSGNGATVAAPSDYTKTFIETRHRTVLSSAFSVATGQRVSIELVIPAKPGRKDDA